MTQNDYLNSKEYADDFKKIKKSKDLKRKNGKRFTILGKTHILVKGVDKEANYRKHLAILYSKVAAILWTKNREKGEEMFKLADSIFNDPSLKGYVLSKIE
jgi:hypothetical protein